MVTGISHTFEEFLIRGEPDRMALWSESGPGPIVLYRLSVSFDTSSYRCIEAVRCVHRAALPDGAADDVETSNEDVTGGIVNFVRSPQSRVVQVHVEAQVGVDGDVSVGVRRRRRRVAGSFRRQGCVRWGKWFFGFRGRRWHVGVFTIARSFSGAGSGNGGSDHRFYFFLAQRDLGIGSEGQYSLPTGKPPARGVTTSPLGQRVPTAPAPTGSASPGRSRTNRSPRPGHPRQARTRHTEWAFQPSYSTVDAL